MRRHADVIFLIGRGRQRIDRCRMRKGFVFRRQRRRSDLRHHVAGIQAANIANMISVGIGDAEILHEAKYNFKDFTFMDLSFIEALLD